MEECRKHRSSFKCCVKEKKKEKNCPTYENELSLYKKEISRKIEEFRLARWKWVESRKEGEKIKADKNDALYESSAYRGRFIRLKKIGLNTIRLREHYQTVKPLPYFTLKPEISETYLSKLKEEREQREAQRERARLADQEWFDEDTMLRDKKERLWEEREKEIQDLVDEVVKEKKKKRRKGPSERAIENLKASKQADRFLESCKCDDRKEVTVVIKGFCLCDKSNLKTLKLNKISDDIKKLESKSEPERVESEPSVVDSIEFHKKQIDHKSRMTKKNDLECEMTRSKSAKSISFEPSKSREKRDNEWKSEDEQKREQEEERKGEKLGKKQGCRKKAQEEKEQEGKRKVRGEEEMEQEERRKEQEEKQQEEKRKEREETVVKQEEKSKEKKKELRKREEEKEKSQNGLENEASVITLFRNTLPKKSEMALTREQFEKMKNIPE